MHSNNAQSKKTTVETADVEPFDSAVFFSVVGDGCTVQNYLKNRIVFAQGDRADSVYYLQHGKLKLVVVSPRGKEAVIAILTEGFFFGEGCLAGQPLRISTAVAIANSSVAEVQTSTMTRILRDEPAFAQTFMTHLLTRNARIEEDLIDHLFNSSEKRLARVLLLLANFGKETRSEGPVVQISQETLAEMIGTTRSRVSFFLNKFRKLGFVEYNSQGLEIHGSLLSVILHD